MESIPKVFEYMKMTNVGEDRLDILDDPEHNPEDIDLLAFGYHAYHGF